MENLRPSPGTLGLKQTTWFCISTPSSSSSSRGTDLRMRGEDQLNTLSDKSEWVPLFFPLTRQGRMASPWEQSSRYKCHLLP